MIHILIIALTLASAAVPAYAADPSLCTLDIEVAIAPGLSATPTTATFTSGPGTIACRDRTGRRRVQELAAAGVLGLFGGATCTQGIGGGTLAWGERTVDTTFTWVGTIGSLGGTAISGAIELTLLGSDCRSAPATRAHLHSVALVR